MPYRNLIFSNNQFYHIYNHSVGEEEIFLKKYDLKRIIELIKFYRFSTPISFSHCKRLKEQEKDDMLKNIHKNNPLVEIHSFSLMPNHFHFLLKQKSDNGIKEFISNIQNGFAKYFNLKNKRLGSLFCNMFNAVLIESEEQFYHVTRYIHLNPVTSYLIKIEDLELYPYTSFTTYMNNINYEFIEKSIIMSRFRTKEKYKKFVFDQVDYQRKLALIKRLMIEKYPRVSS